MLKVTEIIESPWTLKRKLQWLTPM